MLLPRMLKTMSTVIAKRSRRMNDAALLRLLGGCSRGLLLRPLHERLSPAGGGIRVDLEDREPAAFADADAQQADATGFVVHLLQFDFLPAERGLEAVEFRDLVHRSSSLLDLTVRTGC